MDAAETLSTFMVNDQPDPVRFQKAVGNTITAAAKAARGEHPRVAACGECAPLLWAQGNAEAAIRVEHLWDEIAKIYDLDTLCGYPHWAAFTLSKTATSSNESVQNIQLFIPSETDY